MGAELTPAMKAMLKQGEKQTRNDENGLSGKERLAKMFIPYVDSKKGATMKQYRVRIVPDPADSPHKTPFREIEVHEIRVNGKNEKYVCPKQLGKECPMCDTHDALVAMEDDDSKEAAKKYRKRIFYVVRLIDRDAESEGVKFWRFRKNWKGKGEFDKLTAKIASGKDILSSDENGWDLIITCTPDKDGYSVISDISHEEKMPLAKTQEQIDALVNDPLQWSDIYVVKSTQDLEDVVNGKAKYWDDNLKKYVTPGNEEKPLNEVSKEDVNFEQSTLANLGVEDAKIDVKNDLVESTPDDEDLPF